MVSEGSLLEKIINLEFQNQMIAGAMEKCYAAMTEEDCLKSLFNNDYFWL